MGLCDCVHAFILSHGITGFVRVPEKQREVIRAWIWWIRIILPHGHKPLWYSTVSHLSFWSRVYTNLRGSWVFDGSPPAVDGINIVSIFIFIFIFIFFFCQLIFVQKSARSYLARLICQSRRLDKLPVRGELTWVPPHIPLYVSVG